MLLWRPRLSLLQCVLKSEMTAHIHVCICNVSRCTAVVIHMKCSNHRLETPNSTVRGVVKPMGDFFVHGVLTLRALCNADIDNVLS